MKIKTINQTFTEEEIEPAQKLKDRKKWTWKKHIINTTEDYISNEKEDEE